MPQPLPAQEPPQTGASQPIQVTPGPAAIKDKDLWERTGYLHPFWRMPKYIWHDQKAFWTSPFHTAKRDVKWWIVLGGIEGGLLATDKWMEKQLPNTSDQTHLGADFSNFGASYTLAPIAAGFYFIGSAKHSERFRETGMLTFEALLDSAIVETVLKTATDRARPLEANGKGGFGDSTGPRWNSSFPSGHAINTFALASVFAHEYKRTWWVKALAYGYAGTVVGARLAARKHFPGDVFAGGVMGWFIGDYVYAKRHNPDLDEKSSFGRKVLAHVRIGGGLD